MAERRWRVVVGATLLVACGVVGCGQAGDAQLKTLCAIAEREQSRARSSALERALGIIAAFNATNPSGGVRAAFQLTTHCEMGEKYGCLQRNLERLADVRGWTCAPLEAAYRAAAAELTARELAESGAAAAAAAEAQARAEAAAEAARQRATIEGRGTGLSDEVISRVLRRNMPEARHCYEQGREGDPRLAGRVDVRFVISATGAVEAVEVGPSTLNHPGVEACVAASVRRRTFPAPADGRPVSAVFPYVFAAEPGR